MSNLTFTIGEVATLLGITPKTIKHYHKIGLLPQPNRDTNHYRRYDMTHIIQLQQILQWKQFGLSLAQIEIIIKSENPDELIRIVLSQHANKIQDEIHKLQNQHAAIQNFLTSTAPLSETLQSNKPRVSSLATLSDAIKLHSSGMSDILVEVEATPLYQLDQFDWDINYELFWHHTGKQLVDMVANEHLFIFWMERYLALATMDHDDWQGQAWLQELSHSPARHLLTKAFMPPTFSILPDKDRQQIRKLLPALLYQAGSPLQKHFLALLSQR